MTTMTATDTSTPPSSSGLPDLPPAPEEDDIPDPVVPEGALASSPPQGPLSQQWREHEALLHGFTAQIQRWMLDYHAQMMKCVEATLEPVRQCLLKAQSDNEHASYTLADALLKMQEQGIAVRTAPYVMSVQAYAEGGYAMSFTVSKTTAADLVEGVAALLAWLKQAGYAGVPSQMAG
jgi:hypothetical protein